MACHTFKVGDRVLLTKDLPGHASKPTAGKLGKVSLVGVGPKGDEVSVYWDDGSGNTLFEKCGSCGGNCISFLATLTVTAVAAPAATSGSVPVAQGGGSSSSSSSSPFKVGDLVVCTFDLPHNAAPRVGDTGMVTNVAGSQFEVRWDKNGLFSHHYFDGTPCAACGRDCSQFFMLVAPPVPAPTSNAPTAVPAANTYRSPTGATFAIGDRVTTIIDLPGHGILKGSCGTITSVGRITLSILWDGSGGYTTHHEFVNCRCGINCLDQISKFFTIDLTLPAKLPLPAIKAHVCTCGGHAEGFKDYSNVGHYDWCDAYYTKDPAPKKSKLVA